MQSSCELCNPREVCRKGPSEPFSAHSFAHRDARCKASPKHRRGRRHALAAPAPCFTNVRRNKPSQEDASSRALS